MRHVCMYTHPSIHHTERHHYLVQQPHKKTHSRCNSTAHPGLSLYDAQCQRGNNPTRGSSAPSAQSSTPKTHLQSKIFLEYIYFYAKHIFLSNTPRTGAELCRLHMSAKPSTPLPSRSPASPAGSACHRQRRGSGCTLPPSTWSCLNRLRSTGALHTAAARLLKVSPAGFEPGRQRVVQQPSHLFAGLSYSPRMSEVRRHVLNLLQELRQRDAIFDDAAALFCPRSSSFRLWSRYSSSSSPFCSC